MVNAKSQLARYLRELTLSARTAGLTDLEWAQRAGVRNETLSRLRRQADCDLATLTSLAEVVGAQLTLVAVRVPRTTADGHFPAELGRAYEQALAELCASGTVEISRWLALGPRFFMAGLAVLVASVPGVDRRALLELAEVLHPGASEVSVFQRWLDRSPLRPTRFLPLLDAERSVAA
jgi:hypothetical protein